MLGPTRPKPAASLAVAIAWALALGAVGATRYRGSWAFYHGLHERLSKLGVPGGVRNLDYVAIMLGAAALAAIAACLLTRATFADALALRCPRRGWWRMVLLASAPMIVGGCVLMVLRSAWPDAGELAKLVVRAPIVEEVLFRGALVALPLATLGDRPRVFWIAAVTSSILFGSLHAPWTADGFASGWASVLVAGLGGVWYAWVMRAWRSVFVTIALHAVMNLGWTLAGAAGGAGGGGWIENSLRVATIVIATVWTMRLIRARKEPQP
ncbi:MAG: CPBP family intramembrane glutamic endopeptidase [Phycisphaerales bacterium]